MVKLEIVIVWQKLYYEYSIDLFWEKNVEIW